MAETTTTHGVKDGPTWITDDTGKFVPYWSGPQIRQAVEEVRALGHRTPVITPVIATWDAACAAIKARLRLEEENDG